MDEIKKINELIGHTLTDVKIIGDSFIHEIQFIREDGAIIKMYHEQDCCEGVELVDYDGDFDDLIGAVIIEAESVSSVDSQEFHREDKNRSLDEAFLWTFYKIATTKGFVNMRWLGESNGYYSVNMDLRIIYPDGQIKQI